MDLRNNITIKLLLLCSLLCAAKTTTITEEELKQILQDWKKQIQEEMFQQFETIRSDVQQVKNDVQELKYDGQENTCQLKMLVFQINETIAEECSEQIQDSEYFYTT